MSKFIAACCLLLSPIAFAQYFPGGVAIYNSFEFPDAVSGDNAFWESLKSGIDSPIPLIRNDNDDFRFYAPSHNRTWKFTQTSDPDDPMGMKAMTSIRSDNFYFSDPSSPDPDLATNNKVFKYLMNIYKDTATGHLYGLLHIEDLRDNDCHEEEELTCGEPGNHYPAIHGELTKYALGLARCKFGSVPYPCENGGWEVLGKIIHPFSVDGINTNIGGVPFMVKDDYIYVYYNEYAVNSPQYYLGLEHTQWMSSARALIDSVEMFADQHTTGGYDSPWHKFRGFGEGDCSSNTPFAATCWDISPWGLGGFVPGLEWREAHTDMVYSSVRQRYYMPVMEHFENHPELRALRMLSSADGITWDPIDPELGAMWIANIPMENAYFTIVPDKLDTASDDGSVAGFPYIYVLYSQQDATITNGICDLSLCQHPSTLYSKKLSLVSPGPNKAATVDYDGDKMSDLSVKLSNYSWIIDMSSNGFQRLETPEQNADLIRYLNGENGMAAQGDFDGDSRTDISLKNDDGEWKIDYAANGFGDWDSIYTGWGGAECQPVPADYNGDGITDLSVFNTDGYNGGWAIDTSGNGFDPELDMVNADVWRSGWHGLTEHPVPADYDGDDKADMSVKDIYGYWSVDYAGNGYTAWDSVWSDWGDETYLPAPADYDGDGKTDLAVMYTGGYTTWYLDYAVNGFDSGYYNADEYYTPFATTPMKPAPSDYDGDGKADMAGKSDYFGAWAIDYSFNGFGTQDVWLGGWGGDSYHALHKSKPPAMTASLQNRGGLISFSFDLTKASKVRVIVHLADGKKVATMFDGEMNSGANYLSWGREDLSAKGLKRGMYFFTIQADGYKESKKLAFAD